MRALVRSLLLFCLAAVPLAAQTAARGPGAIVYPAAMGAAPAAFPKDAAGGSFSAAAAAFVGVCAAAGLWLWWRRRRGAPALAGRGERRLIVAETRPLGNRQYLVVAAYEDKKYLLGVCPGRIELLAPLESGEPPSVR